MCSLSPIPGFHSVLYLGQAFHLWSQLNSVLLSQDPASSISLERSQMALRMWRRFSEAYFYFSIGFLFLAISALILSLAYTGAAISLSITLRDQIKQTELLFGRFAAPLTFEAVEGRSQAWDCIKMKASERAAAEEESRWAYRWKNFKKRDRKLNQRFATFERAVRSTFYPSIKDPTAQVSFIFHQNPLQNIFRRELSYFLPLLQIADADSPQSRSRALKEALSTVVVLSISINLGVLIFAAWLIYVCSRCYEDSLNGPRSLTQLHR